MDKELLREIWQQHSGKMIGSALGLIASVMVIALGFFQAIFIMLCVLAGYVVGKRIDEKEDITEILERLLPPGYHR